MRLNTHSSSSSRAKSVGGASAPYQTSLSGRGIENYITNRLTFNSKYVSKPVGYSDRALVLPVSYGGIACRMTGTAEVSGNIFATGNIVSNITGEGTLAASGFKGVNLNAPLVGTGGVTCSISAKGHLTCTIEIGAQPSAFDITQAVLNALASQYNIPGTIGNKLNSAGSAGNPWGAALVDNNADGTFGWFIQKLLTVAKFLGLK